MPLSTDGGFLFSAGVQEVVKAAVQSKVIFMSRKSLFEADSFAFRVYNDRCRVCDRPINRNLKPLKSQTVTPRYKAIFKSSKSLENFRIGVYPLCTEQI